ncbi:MAG: carbohydrate-binding protein [Chthoniobacterales bacterium]
MKVLRGVKPSVIAFSALATGWLLTDSARAANYNNPLEWGADPAVVDGQNGFYYMFVTNGFDTRRYRSSDLVNWGNMTDAAYDGYDKRKGWAPTLWKDGATWHMFTVSAHSSTTNIDGTFLPVGNGKGVGFDPMYFGLVGGQHHLYIGGTAVLNQLKLMDDPNTETVGGSTAFYYWPAYFTNIFEGPWVHEHNGTYYLMTSIEVAKGTGYRLAYATADNPRGPWTAQTDERDAAFLRQSDHEQIWGVGHHCMIADSNGTQWVYYQQKEDSGSNWNRKVAVDPLWFDASGHIHMRPTRGTTRPGPNSSPSVIWPTVSASSVIQAETYAGSAYTVLQSGGSGEVVEFVDAGGFLAFRNVNFGSGMNGFTATLSVPVGGTMPASLQIRLDGIDGPVVGALSLSQTTGFVQVTGKLNQTVSGVHDIVIRGQGALVNNSPFILDSFTFTGQGSGSVNLPPVVANDTVETPMDQAIAVSVLNNDSDPEGQTLTITGAGRAGNNTNNDSFKGGTLSISGNAITYTPAGNYWGEDVFFYTVRDSLGLHSRGRVSVHVTPPATVRTFENGLMVVEAEDSFESLQMDDSVTFSTQAAVGGFVGTGYVTTPDNGLGRMGKPTRRTYVLDIPKAKEGIYELWVRVLSPSSNSNSAAFSFSRRPMVYETEDAHRHIPVDKPASGQWTWVKDSQSLSLSTGLYKMSLWRDADGTLIDRFLLTNDPNYNPANENGGVGPLPNNPSNQAPTAIAGPDVSVTDTDDDDFETVTLDGSASDDPDGAIADFTWLVGGTPIGSGNVLNANFAIGVTTVTLQVTDNDGAIGTDTIDVSVSALTSGGSPDLNVIFEAEQIDAHNGVAAANGKLGNINNGEWVRYDDFDFGSGADSVEVSLSSNTTGGTVQFRIGSISSPVIGSVTIGNTGGWNNFVTESTGLSPIPTGIKDLYLTFTGSTTGSLVDIDWLRFNAANPGPGALFNEDFESGSHGFSNLALSSVSGNGVGQATIPASGSVTMKDELGANAIDLAGATSLIVETAVQLPSAEVGNAELRMVVSFNLGGGGTSDVNAAYVPVDGDFIGQFVTYQDTITVPSGATSIDDVRVRFNQNAGGASAQTVYVDDIKVIAD